MKAIVVALIVALMAVPAMAWSGETEAPEYRDWYGNLEARSGMTYSPKTQNWDAYATVPVIGYKALSLELGITADPSEEDDQRGPKAAVLGLTYDIGSLKDFGLDVSWAKYISFHVGPCVSYDFESGEFDFRAMTSGLVFSFDQGNVSRQKADKAR